MASGREAHAIASPRGFLSAISSRNAPGRGGRAEFHLAGARARDSDGPKLGWAKTCDSRLAPVIAGCRSARALDAHNRRDRCRRFASITTPTSEASPGRRGPLPLNGLIGVKLGPLPRKQTLVQVVCSRGKSLRDSIVNDPRLSKSGFSVQKKQKPGRPHGWAKVRSTHRDRQGALNIEWDADTSILVCRISIVVMVGRTCSLATSLTTFCGDSGVESEL
jgi:hypothetical protein